jgi:hypothetical protein
LEKSSSLLFLRASSPPCSWQKFFYSLDHCYQQRKNKAAQRHTGLRRCREQVQLTGALGSLLDHTTMYGHMVCSKTGTPALIRKEPHTRVHCLGAKVVTSAYSLPPTSRVDLHNCEW